MSRIFYIMGKSAAGKDHFYEALQREEGLTLTPMVLYTTRPLRDGECDGREYHFVNRERLEAFRAEGKIIEERTYETVYGPWTYFTADDGSFDDEKKDYLGIGTLESYEQLRKYFGAEVIFPIYIEVEDGIRLRRAIEREEKQQTPKYEEMCRRFLADSEDFSEEKLQSAGIRKKFSNNQTFEKCLENIVAYIKNA